MYYLHMPTLSVITLNDMETFFPGVMIGRSEEGMEGLPVRKLNDPEPLPFDPVYHNREIELVSTPDENEETYTHHIQWKLTPKLPIGLAWEAKEQELNYACYSEITMVRFTSEALGTIHSYGADSIDQMNIQGNVLFAVAVGDICEQYCYTQSGDKLKMDHTPEQMIQVGKDLRTHVLTKVIKCNNLKSQAKIYEQENNYEALTNVRW